MADLTPNDFVAFFTELWGYPPYRWQAELLCWIDQEKRFPKLVPVATGGGKTSMLDIALFALALDIQRPMVDRWAPRRIALVVDRRVVVDQNGFRGAQIAEKLREARENSSVLGRVADLLQALSGGEPFTAEGPVNAAVLRGAIARDESWSERPDVPALLASTVDQVGSRLLFRGYGMSRGARPIHAGLFGSDTLILLDEVHLAVPFAETLEMITDLRNEKDLFRFHTSELSATPRSQLEASTLGARNEPLFAEWFDDEKFAQRTNVEKRAYLRPVVEVAAKKDAEQLAQAFDEELGKLLPTGQPIVAAVMVNQVDRALAAARQISQRPNVDVRLITGRMRGVERDDALRATIGEHSLDEILRERNARAVLTKHLVVVATQCLEAGADYDFDALVTESASIDALVQRFGRLDRKGELTPKGMVRAAVVVGSDDVAGKSRLYGDALMNTWARLQEIADTDNMVEMGVNRTLLEQFPEPPEGPLLYRLATAHAPVMLRAHMNLFVATNPEPSASPDPSLWLHGLDSTAPQITILWRNEISAELDTQIQSATGDELDVLSDQLTEWLRLTRPSEPETVTIPIYALPALFDRRRRSPGAFDVDAVPIDDADTVDDDRRVIVWDGDEATIVNLEDLRAGSAVVLGCHLGGLERFTWSSSSTDPVSDVAEEAVASTARQNRFLRLTPTWAERKGLASDLYADLASLPQRNTDPDERDPNVWLSEWVQSVDQAAAAIFAHDEFSSPYELKYMKLGLDDQPGIVLLPVLAYRHSGGEPDMDDSDEDAENPSFVGYRATLRVHLRGVGDWAEHFGRSILDDQSLIDDLRLAGRLHDLGKADPRFQAWLTDGDSGGDELLAKSGSKRRSRTERDRARKQAQYPKGMRHELLSLELMDRCGALMAMAHDPDLVRHLVSSHHGHCRPQAKSVFDRKPVMVTVPGNIALDDLETEASALSGHALARMDSGIVRRFQSLLDQYGWYRIAHLEALLRLADHRQSNIDSNGGRAK